MYVKLKICLSQLQAVFCNVDFFSRYKELKSIKNKVSIKSRARKIAELKAKYKSDPNSCPEYAKYLEKQKLAMRERRARAKGSHSTLLINNYLCIK